MTCCTNANTIEIARMIAEGARTRARHEARAGVQLAADGSSHCRLSVPGIHCGACIPTIERGLAGCEGVTAVRVNLTLRRVDVTLSNADADPVPVLQRLAALGYPATPLEPAGLEDQADAFEAAQLLKALAVAGFGAANIMLMSVAVWSGRTPGCAECFISSRPALQFRW